MKKRLIKVLLLWLCLSLPLIGLWAVGGTPREFAGMMATAYLKAFLLTLLLSGLFLAWFLWKIFRMAKQNSVHIKRIFFDKGGLKAEFVRENQPNTPLDHEE